MIQQTDRLADHKENREEGRGQREQPGKAERLLSVSAFSSFGAVPGSAAVLRFAGPAPGSTLIVSFSAFRGLLIAALSMSFVGDKRPGQLGPQRRSKQAVYAESANQRG